MKQPATKQNTSGSIDFCFSLNERRLRNRFDAFSSRGTDRADKKTCFTPSEWVMCDFSMSRCFRIAEDFLLSVKITRCWIRISLPRDFHQLDRIALSSQMCPRGCFMSRVTAECVRQLTSNPELDTSSAGITGDVLLSHSNANPQCE